MEAAGWVGAHGCRYGNAVMWVDPSGTKASQLFPHEQFEPSWRDYVHSPTAQLKTSLNLQALLNCLSGCTPVSAGNKILPAADNGKTVAEAMIDLFNGRSGVWKCHPIRIENDTTCPKGCCGRAAYFQNLFGKGKWTDWYIILCVVRSFDQNGRVSWKPRRGGGPSHCTSFHELIHVFVLKHSGDPQNQLDGSLFEYVSRVPGCESYSAKSFSKGPGNHSWKYSSSHVIRLNLS